MRKIRYSVAMSLDGYIAGPNGEADWIIMDPEIDFGALFEQFDTFLLGRRTFEAMGRAGQGGTGAPPSAAGHIGFRSIRNFTTISSGTDVWMSSSTRPPGWSYGTSQIASAVNESCA